MTYEQVFSEEISHRLAIYCEKHPTAKIVLVPSLKDQFHDTVYPQPPFDRNTLKLPVPEQSNS